MVLHAFDTVEAIVNAVKKKEDETAFVEMRDQMISDFNDGYALTTFDPGRKGYETYTSSQPRNFYEKVIDGLNRAQLTIQIKVPENAETKDKEAASAGELFLFGALDYIDRRQTRRQEPPLREALGALGCLRGWMSMRVLVYTPKGETHVVFDVQPWDLLHVTWEMGADGLIWACRKRTASRTQIEDEYSDFEFSSSVVDKLKNLWPGTSTSTLEIYDFWTKEHNAVVAHRDFVKEATPHNLNHVPVMIDAVGSLPTIQTASFESTLKHRGNSVWAPSRAIIEPRNKYVSMVMDMAKKSIAGSLVYETELGTKGIEGDPYESFQVIKLKTGETLKPLDVPKSPAEYAAILGIMQEDWQQSTLPYPLAFGGTREAMSGRALSVLADATRSVYTPRTGAMARAYRWLCEEILFQFSKKGKTVELSGYDSREEFFVVKSTPKEINPEWFVSVQVEPRMPRDREAEIQMAQTATLPRPDGSQLVSLETAREEYLRLRDPAAEESKILAERGRNLPPIIAARVAEALKKAGEDDLAEDVLALLKPQQGAPTNGATPEQQQSPLPPELIDAIVEILINIGRPDIAEALLQALGVQPQQAQPAPVEPTGV